MRKIINITILILIISSAFSLKLVQNDNTELSLTFSGIPTFYYDFEAESELNEDVAGFEINTFWMIFEGNKDNISYNFLSSYETGRFLVKEVSAKYRFSDRFALKMGYFQSEIDRLGDSPTKKLNFTKANPIIPYISHGTDYGISPELRLFDNKLEIELGVFGYSQKVYSDYGYSFNYTGAFHYMPFGRMNLAESSLKNDENFKMDICPVIDYRNHRDSEDFGMYDLSSGLQAAIRKAALSLDLSGFYKIKSKESEVFDRETTVGSAYLSYLINKKIEPSVRYSYIKEYDGSRSSGDEYTIYYKEHNIMEIGTIYYLDGENAQIGLHYEYKDIRRDRIYSNPTEIYSNLKLYYALQF